MRVLIWEFNKILYEQDDVESRVSRIIILTPRSIKSLLGTPYILEPSFLQNNYLYIFKKKYKVYIENKTEIDRRWPKLSLHFSWLALKYLNTVTHVPTFII